MRGCATFTQLSGVQILDKEVLHYSTYPDSSDTSFKRQGECKVGMVSHLDYLGYLSLLIKWFEEIAQADTSFINHHFTGPLIYFGQPGYEISNGISLSKTFSINLEISNSGGEIRWFDLGNSPPTPKSLCCPLHCIQEFILLISNFSFGGVSA